VLGSHRIPGFLVAAAGLWMAASAQAAPVPYTMQMGESTGHEFVLDGNNLAAFSLSVTPKTCTSGPWQNDSDAAWTVTLNRTVPVVGGHFRFQGQAPSANYSTGSADYTVTGTVDPARGPGASARRTARGTISFTNGSDPFVGGCSGSYTFLAIPTPQTSENVGGPGSTDFTSQFLSFDYRKGVVRNLVVQANFQCATPDPSVDDAEVDASAYGYGRIHVHQGRFSLRTYVLDGYQDIVRLDLTGHVRGSRASGRIKISEPSGLEFVAGVPCSGDYTWTAARPAPPSPSATFSWAAVRVPNGASYRYYFYVTNLTCQNGATAVDVVVRARRRRIRCSAGQGWASGPLSPGRSYSTRAQAVKMRHGRIIGRGIPVRATEQMPAADATWQPIGSLPGHPPS
jgi:hypothetical protein